MQNHTGQLTRMLDGLGVAQTVITTRPPGAPASAAAGGARILRVGLPVRLTRQGWALPAARLALRAAREADLVHAHLGEDLAVLPIARRAAAASGVPLVVTVHTSLRHTFTPDGPPGRLLKALGGRIEERTCRVADRVIVLTPRLAQQIDADPARVHVIPSGARRAAFAAAGPDPWGELPGPRVLFVGRLARQKAPEVLVAAAARLRTPGVRIVLVGDGPSRGLVEAAIRRHRVEDRVRIAGFRPHREVPCWLNHADVFAMPSRYEELGSALVEALFAGLPIVASHTGGIPDAVGDAALLVPPEDPAALARALDGLLADAGARADLAARARERSRRFDWEGLAREVLSVYELALRGPQELPGADQETLVPA
jgi:glycosyltransferase involved in cell wall biosynthesis